MNRREFLALAGASTTYSVLVSVPGLSADSPRASVHDEIATGFDPIAPSVPAADRWVGEPHMSLVDLACDFCVAGGGMAGVCAALAAARHGAKVVLVQDRSRLGGNASSEVKMHIVGADIHGSRPGWREGGILEELRLDDAQGNPQRSHELWDLLLYDKVKSAPNLTLLLDTVCTAAETREGHIQRVLARCDKTEHLYRITARLYADCTGDGRLAVEAGADVRRGRETKQEYGESLARDVADAQTLGSSVLFTSRNHGRPMPFRPPAWARKITREMLRFRPISSWEYGYWWIEWGGALDPIRDQERIRFELLSIALGVWDYIKNSGEHPTSGPWALDWLGMVPGKRGSRRILGDHILTQRDLMGETGDFPDAVCIGGWSLDDHPPGGFDRPDLRPATQIAPPAPYNIPLRSLYSRNVGNLMMAGRNISASHVAFTSTRVMATCAVMGQAVGTAAALCLRQGLSPRQLTQQPERVAELQQVLLRDDQTIRHRRNEDPQDLARQAEVTASDALAEAPPEQVINGFVRDQPGRWENRWAARWKPEGVFLQLTWAQPRTLRQVQITFDTGFQRELTLSQSDSVTAKMVRGPQPETVRDYALLYRGPGTADWVSLVKVTGNYQRLCRHSFGPITTTALRLHITATNGDELVRVFEVRCYG